MQQVGWSTETPDLFTARIGEDWFGDARPGQVWTGLRHYMVVEALPLGGWEWLAWANDGTGQAMHGTAASREDAKRAAEHGAMLLRGQAGRQVHRRPFADAMALNS